MNASPLNGNVPRQIWSIRNSVGDVLAPGGNGVAIHSNFFVDVSSQAAD